MNEKNNYLQSNKKSRQHYVWKQYLKSWTQGERIFCLRENVIFVTNAINVAVEKDFYKLKELTTFDIEFIQRIILSIPDPKLQKFHSGWFTLFNLIFKIKSEISQNRDPTEGNNVEFDQMINNFIEDLHCDIESNAIQYIDSILKSDINFFKTKEDRYRFIHFLCVQYMRTNKIKSEIISKANQSLPNIERIWDIWSHILATNMAYSLFLDRQYFNLLLLINKTSIPLLTCDQPVFNTYAKKKGMVDASVPSELELYYPVSPFLAVLLSKKEEYKTTDKLFLSEDQVSLYNEHIYNCSHEQIYSNSKEVLEKFISKTK